MCLYKLYCDMQRKINTQCVLRTYTSPVCCMYTYSPIQHTSYILSVMNCNEFSTLLLLVYMPLMLKHPFLCSVFVPIQIGFYFR